MTLTFEPLLPPIAWITMVILAVALWGWYAMKRPAACGRGLWSVIMALTAAGIAAVLVVLLNPIWVEPLPPPAGKPLLTVLIDNSKSMATADTPGDSRFSAATTIVQELAPNLSKQFDLRIQTFAEEASPINLNQLKQSHPDGSATDLSVPLMDAFVSDRPQGQAVLVLSDGVHNAGGSIDRVLQAAETAKAWDAPIFTTTLGADVQVDDLEVRVPRSQELAFVGQSIPVAIELLQHGSVTDRVEVTLIDPEGEETTQTVRIKPDEVAETSFMVTPPETGLFQYRVKTSAFPGEATPANNSATFQVRVVDKPVRALVLEGKPYWDAKFLLRMLTDDPSLEVDYIVRISDERYLWRKLKLVDSVGTAANQDEADVPNNEPGNAAGSALRFQRREEMEFVDTVQTLLQDPKTLREYQILLLGREAESYLGDAAIENIRAWIAQDGGSLVCYRGSPVAEPNQKLARLLPVRWATGRNAGDNEARFRIQVTERGDDMNWLRIGGSDGLSKLPSLATSATTEGLKPLAVVLGRSDSAGRTSPVLTYQPYGMGKAVVVEGSGMWRWAFLAPEYQQMESAYGTLWQSLLRWLISSGGLLPGEDVALQMDRVTYTDGESVSAVVLRRPELDSADLPSVRIVDGKGQLVQSVQPMAVGEELGVYQVFIGILPAGNYQAELESQEDGQPVTKSVHFDVRPDLREQLEVSSRADLMQRIAEISGGETLTPDELPDLASKFNAHIAQSRPVRYQRNAAWDRWWVLMTILIVWSVTWGLRRRTGLV